MTEIEFIESIDFSFPYENEKKAFEIIDIGRQISPNASFMVLHEICRAPKDIKRKTQLKLVRQWQLINDHPLMELVLTSAKAIINRSYIVNNAAIQAFKVIAGYSGQYNALSIVYFSCEEPNEEIEKAYNQAVNSMK